MGLLKPISKPSRGHKNARMQMGLDSFHQRISEYKQIKANSMPLKEEQELRHYFAIHLAITLFGRNI